ncbi:hypothetical protein ACFL02_08990 [Planctomycetota bacterium]
MDEFIKSYINALGAIVTALKNELKSNDLVAGGKKLAFLAKLD